MTFTSQLSRYAQLLLTSGLRLKPGDKLIIKFNAQQLPFVRLVTQQAYQLDAADIVFDFQDDDLTLARYTYLSPTYHKYFPFEKARHPLALYQDGYAQLTLIGANPDLLADVSPEIISVLSQTRNQAMKKMMQYGMANHTKWLVAAAATTEWAIKVFPDTSPENALTKLWQAIFFACRITTDSDNLAWTVHNNTLKKYRDYLNHKQYDALHFKNKTTDLIIGLPAHHLWQAGTERTTTGESFVSNLPVEEVWTMPNRRRVDGYTAITKPFSFNGVTINKLSLVFKNGKVTQFNSDQPQIIRGLLNADEAASYLGEVALVPESSPINQTGIVFHQTLFDENAASHLAFGQAYENNLLAGATLTLAEKEKRGMNDSAIHQDFMIGNHQMSVAGHLLNGDKEPIMLNGEWVI